MGFSAKQVQALRRNLDGRQIRTREANGRELSYIEGWYAISEANRIFGFDGWNRETLDPRCVLTRENRGSFVAVYLAKVRITVKVHGTTTIREGHGTGEGRGTSPGEVHDIARKAQKPMPPNERWRPSANRSGFSFIARTLGRRSRRQRQVHDTTTGRFSPRRYDADPTAVALLRPAAP